MFGISSYGKDAIAVNMHTLTVYFSHNTTVAFRVKGGQTITNGDCDRMGKRTEKHLMFFTAGNPISRREPKKQFQIQLKLAFRKTIFDAVKSITLEKMHMGENNVRHTGDEVNAGSTEHKKVR